MGDSVVVVGASVVVVVGASVVVGAVVGATVVGAAVVVVTGGVGAQNWTFEMSGVFLPLPTLGRSLFENVPDDVGGVYSAFFEPGPPLTTITEIGVVELHSPPSTSALRIVTTS